MYLTLYERELMQSNYSLPLQQQGRSHECASKVPLAYRRTGFSSVVEELAKMHNYYWITQPYREVKEYAKSDSFWQSQVSCELQ